VINVLKEFEVREHDDDFSAIMVLNPLHRHALDRAYKVLGLANMLHADSMFDGEESADKVLHNCFNPVRAAADAMLTGRGIVSIVDSNFVSGLRRILETKQGASLTTENKEIISFLIISAMCDGAITPGMAFHEMLGNSGHTEHLTESYNAFEYLCAEVELDYLCSILLQDTMPFWGVKERLSQEIPLPMFQKIQQVAGGQRYKSELFSTIIAATVEIKYSQKMGSNAKFHRFVESIYCSGAFAMGSLRYFSLHFSEMPSTLGVSRGTMLKQVHSSNPDKVRRDVLNAASDCYFASEYGSSMNSFGERGEPRVFVTSDRALKAVMASDFNDRSLWAGGVSATIDRLRGQQMDAQTAEMINDAVPIFDVGAVPSPRPPIREIAKRFLKHQDQALNDAWCELEALVASNS
jgi:hypothetical protein